MILERMWRSCRQWRLRTLADFWSVAHWLERERLRGHAESAQRTYLRRMTGIVRDCVERYGRCLRRLDALCGGILANPATAVRLNLHWTEKDSLLAHFEKTGLELLQWINRLEDGPIDEAVRQWEQRLDDPEAYRTFLTTLIHHFGNYEVIAMALPGTGPIVTDCRVQTVLREMFTIKRRLIRLLELIYSVRKAWRAHPPCTSLGFFNPTTDLSRVVRGMLVEYMVQADPERIAHARQQAKLAGRSYVRYRFWRPAEALRQLALVEYEAGPTRRPRPRRHYVDVRTGQVPTLCTDTTRLEWAIKELFNNALAATSVISVTDQGLDAKLLRDETDGRASPAITLTVTALKQRRWWGSRRFVRLVIADNGVGIDTEVLRYVPMWAFSTQRDWVDEPPDRIIGTPTVESRQLMIGGKGIGLAFAQATIRELGGELSLRSRAGQGTEVTIDLPVPTLPEA